MQHNSEKTRRGELKGRFPTFDRLRWDHEKTRSNELNLQRRGLAKHNEFHSPVYRSERQNSVEVRDEYDRILYAFRAHSGNIIPYALRTLMDLESMWNNPSIFVDRLKSAATPQWCDIISTPPDRYKKLIQGLFIDRFRSSTAFRIQADVAHAILSEIKRIRNTVLPYSIDVEYQQAMLFEVSKLKSVLERCAQPISQFPQWSELINRTLHKMVSSYQETPDMEYNGEADTDTEMQWVRRHCEWGDGWDEMCGITVYSARIFETGPGSIDCQEIFSKYPQDVLDDFELRDHVFGGGGQGFTYEVDIANVVCEVNVQNVNEIDPGLLHECIDICNERVDDTPQALHPCHEIISVGNTHPSDANSTIDRLKECIKQHFNSYGITSIIVKSVYNIKSLQVCIAFNGVDRDTDLGRISAFHMHNRYHYLTICPATLYIPAFVNLVSVKMNSDACGEISPFDEKDLLDKAIGNS
jgi:hypothetical protein